MRFSNQQSSAQNKGNERVASIQELFSKAPSDKAVLLPPVLRHYGFSYIHLMTVCTECSFKRVKMKMTFTN